MKPVFPMPVPETLFDFVAQSNKIEHEETSLADVLSVFNRKNLTPIPVIGGQIEAIGYAIQLASQEDFPAKHPVQWKNDSAAITNLYWLKSIHQKIMKPIADNAFNFDFGTNIKPQDCGPFRLEPRSIAMERKLPDPILINPLMKQWYATIGEFHLAVLPKLKLPNHQTLMDIERAAWNAHLQLQCIHPWVDGTGRCARIMENALRLRWGLPWKTLPARDANKYSRQIMAYEDGPEWQHVMSTANDCLSR